MSEIQHFKYLYELLYTDEGVDYPFYIGKSNDTDRRLKEHNYSKNEGSEDKYIFIRMLEKSGLKWTLRVIKEVPVDEYVEDWERYHLIEYVRLGYDMMNMKHGDLDVIAEQVADVKIRSIDDVIKDRVRRESEKEYKQFERADRTRTAIEKINIKTDLRDLIADSEFSEKYRTYWLSKHLYVVEGTKNTRMALKKNDRGNPRLLVAFCRMDVHAYSKKCDSPLSTLCEKVSEQYETYDEWLRDMKILGCNVVRK